MKASNLNATELRKEIRRLEKNLKRRTSNISKLQDEASQTAVEKFYDLRLELADLGNLTEKELRTLHRDLRYINAMPTSYVKGAKKVVTNLRSLAEKLQLDGTYSNLYELYSASGDMYKKLEEIYGKVSSYIGKGITEMFRYEVLESSVDYIYSGQDVDKAVEDLIKLYDKTVKELGGSATDEKIRVLFTSRLDSLFK